MQRTKTINYRGEVDYFIVHCYENEETYLIPVEDVGVSNVALRIEKLPKTSPYSTTRWAKEYKLRRTNNNA
jgi:hypothetical protein